MLDVLEAQGRRQAPGSQTEFNKLIVKDLSEGGGGDVAGLLASPQKWLSFAQDAYRQFRYGKNTEMFANIFTSPDAVAELKKIAKLDPRSQRAQAIVSNLIVSRAAYEHGSGKQAP
jgi:hypothetical protein